MRISARDVFQKVIQFAYEKVELKDLDIFLHQYINQESADREENNKELLLLMQDVLEAFRVSEYYYYLLTFMINATGDIPLCKMMISDILADDTMSGGQLYYGFTYLERLDFLGIISIDPDLTEGMCELYHKANCFFAERLDIPKEIIPVYERDNDLILVITTQMLTLNHGPTKTALDRCRIIAKVMEKKVALLNTSEIVNRKGAFMAFGFPKGNYLDTYEGKSVLEYEGCEIPYYHYCGDMPNLEEMQSIVDLVKERKPYCIVTIGGGSIASDLCSRFIPTITLSLSPSNKQYTYSQFQAIGYIPSEQDYRWARLNGLSQDHFITALFTSSFKQQEHHYERAQLGLPESGFIAILVGGRLDQEIDEECLKMLLSLMEKGIFIAFAGVFDRYDVIKQNPLVAKSSRFLGFQSDMLAVLECCDLYINPIRIGGGTSVAEALFKGVPVVTTSHGDGGVGAGSDFWVEDYTQMEKEVLRYRDDKDYCLKQQKNAKARADRLTDSAGEFSGLMQKVFESRYF